MCGLLMQHLQRGGPDGMLLQKFLEPLERVLKKFPSIPIES